MSDRFQKKSFEHVLVLIITLCVCKVLMTLHLPNIDNIAGASYDVVQGRPRWVAFQNRLLGPYLVLFISKLARISYHNAWIAFTVLFTFAEGLLVYNLLTRRVESRDTPIRFLIIFFFVFLSLQFYWLYTWDNIDITIFTVFAYAVVFETGLHGLRFAILFLVALANRESAMFISFYMVLEAFEYDAGRRPRLRLASVPKLLSGALLTAAAIFYTKWVRTRLFVDRSSDAEHQAIGNHLYLPGNLVDLFWGNFHSAKILNTLVFVAVLWYFVPKIKTADRGEMLALVLSAVIMANIFVFGVFNETRSYFVLMPFLYFVWLKRSGVPR